MLLNILKLKEDMRATAAAIRTRKDIARESGQPRMTWRVRGELSQLKERATQLCALRAHGRGKLHLPRKLDAAAQAAFVAALLPQYAPEAPAVERQE